MPSKFTSTNNNQFKFKKLLQHINENFNAYSLLTTVTIAIFGFIFAIRQSKVNELRIIKNKYLYDAHFAINDYHIKAKFKELKTDDIIKLRSAIHAIQVYGNEDEINEIAKYISVMSGNQEGAQKILTKNGYMLYYDGNTIVNLLRDNLREEFNLKKLNRNFILLEKDLFNFPDPKDSIERKNESDPIQIR